MSDQWTTIGAMRGFALLLACVAGLVLSSSVSAANGDAAARQVVRKHVLKIRFLSDQYAPCTPDRPYCTGNAGYRIAAYVRDARPSVSALLTLRLSARVKSGLRYYLQALTAYQVSGLASYTAVRTQNAALLTTAIQNTARAVRLSNRAISLIYS
jgi:hypothetical protein